MSSLLFSLALAGSIVVGVSDTIPYANTIEILPTDSEEAIVAKAAHVVPTANQLDALDREFIGFVHIGPNTFSRTEWGTGFEKPEDFKLKTLDTDQWARAMSAAGMKMVILTVKHHDGFVIWQSRYTRHGIMESPFADGRGDILRSLSESCRKYGLRLGIYLSPADLYQIESPDGLYGNGSKPTMRTIPRPVEGRPFADTRTFSFEVDDYNEYFMNQLFELLTEYGPIHEVWFDGAHPKRKGGQTYNYKAWRELIRVLAPEAVVFGRQDVRWCGNEAGATRPTEWNVIPYAADPDTMQVFSDLTADDLGSREKLIGAAYLHYQQPEVDTSIREGWFYRDDSHQRTRSADDVFDIYERSVGGNATFLLNVPPNREGSFSDRDVAVLEEVGRRIRSTYSTSLLDGASGSARLLDGDARSTFVEVDTPIVIVPQAPITINRIVLCEPIGIRGERIEHHKAEGRVDGRWQLLAEATNVGHKRILRFPEATVDSLRITVDAARLTPALSFVSAHYYPPHPPRLIVKQNADGNVSIFPESGAFRWNYSPSGAAAPEIRYTTDGAMPGPDSKLYTSPFPAAPCTVKAVALTEGRIGSVTEEIIGYSSSDFNVCGDFSKSFDASSATVDELLLGEGIVVEMCRKPYPIVKGIAYTPPADGCGGLMSKVEVSTSSDGKCWTKQDSFTFGNLKNDPTTRYFRFAKPVTARYIKITPTATEDGVEKARIAELLLF